MTDIQAEHKEQTAKPPYVSYKTFRGFLETLSVKGIPSRIDSSVLPTMSGVNQKQVISALKFLGLIDENNNTNEELKLLVESEGEEKEKIIKRIIYSSYPFLFDGDFISTATTQGVEEKFRETGISGETISRSILFFMHFAKEANIRISEYIQPYKGKSRSRMNKRKEAEQQGIEDEQSEPISTQSSQNPNQKVIADFISKFPEFNPEWELDAQKSWYDAYSQMYEKITKKSEKDSNE